MIFLLDILGSTIAASLVLLTLVQFNFTTSEIRNEFQSSNTVNSGTKDLADVMEFDFYKAGFRVAHRNVFISANDSSVKFLADLHNDGILDTVYYYLGGNWQASYTDNPDDKPLFRQINNSAASNMGNVKDFTISYHDSARNVIPLFFLTTQSGRNKIKSVSLNLVYESIWKSNESYQNAEWRKTIKPKNIR
jgi:hypothetical protein